MSATEDDPLGLRVLVEIRVYHSGKVCYSVAGSDPDSDIQHAAAVLVHNQRMGGPEIARYVDERSYHHLVDPITDPKEKRAADWIPETAPRLVHRLVEALERKVLKDPVGGFRARAKDGTPRAPQRLMYEADKKAFARAVYYIERAAERHNASWDREIVFDLAVERLQLEERGMIPKEWQGEERTAKLQRIAKEGRRLLRESGEPLEDEPGGQPENT